jgi:hypothetical protein
MSRKARSALGQLVDFDLLAIKEQLATTPVPVGVDQRRRFIDEKDGIKTKEVVQPVDAEVPSALNIAMEAAQQSASAETSDSSQKKKR